MNSWDDARSSCSAPQEGLSVYLSEAEAQEQEVMSGEEDELDGRDPEDGEGGEGLGERTGKGYRGGYSDGGEDGAGAVMTQGISSRGRVVRSRWNTRRATRR